MVQPSSVSLLGGNTVINWKEYSAPVSSFVVIGEVFNISMLPIQRDILDVTGHKEESFPYRDSKKGLMSSATMSLDINYDETTFASFKHAAEGEDLFSFEFVLPYKITSNPVYVNGYVSSASLSIPLKDRISFKLEIAIYGRIFLKTE